MANAELSRRVEKVVGYPPLVEMDDKQRRQFHEALLETDTFERPTREVAGGDSQGGSGTSAAPPCQPRVATAGRSAPNEPPQLRRLV